MKRIIGSLLVRYMSCSKGLIYWLEVIEADVMTKSPTIGRTTLPDSIVKEIQS